MSALTAECILDALQADGYHVSIGSETDPADGAITFRAEASKGGEWWCASADSEYRAVFALAVALGWNFED